MVKNNQKTIKEIKKWQTVGRNNKMLLKVKKWLINSQYHTLLESNQILSTRARND